MSDFDGYVRGQANKSEYSTWKDAVEKNPEFQKHGDVIVSRGSHTFFKAVTVLFFLFIVIVAGLYFYLLYEGKLSPTFYNTVTNMFHYNFTTMTTNSYQFDPSTTNNYQHSISLNITLSPVIYNNCS